ncbi:MAG TPA: pyridoxamine 5'-phosphate oxidase family protein [Dehalococcoidia bacterium]|nr:pyridoxamine 5'-phosphate oxidase family protein [Dehalococcoidia bacterium]
MNDERPRTRRAKLIRYAKRAVDDRSELDAILRDGLVAHVGFAAGDQPFVVPMTYLYRDGRLFLHGSRGSRALKHLASGAPACVTVTLLDALIASKAASSHSMNYRSVVVFGRGKPVRSQAAVVDLSHAIIERYFPDRRPGEAYRPVQDDELKSVRFVEIAIEEMSGKRRTGGPINELDSDPGAIGWSGVLPVSHRGSIG